jgi:membrane protease YdiL (CAAX protease family)
MMDPRPVLNDISLQRQRPRFATWFGLLIALSSLFLIRQVFRGVSPNPGTGAVVVREGLNFASAGALLVLVKRWEQLPLASIGLGTSVWWKSVLWGGVAMLLCGAAVGLLGMVTTGGGGTASPFDRLPLWVCAFIVLRAGIVEEIFFRGYAIERLRMVGAGRVGAAVFPLLLFAVGHYAGNWIDILQPLVLGGILTGLYVWRRDLVANILAHLLVDLVGTGLGARLLK